MSTQKFKNYQDVKQAAEGNWAYVLSRCAPELELALEAASSKRGPSHVACPVHGGVDGFRLFKDFNLKGGGICNTCGSKTNGFALIAWIRQYEIKDAVREVAQCLGGSEGVQVVRARKAAPTPVAAENQPTPKWVTRQINEAWSGAKSIHGSAVQRYLENRGLPTHALPSTLRFHPHLPYFLKGSKEPMGYFPCLLAPVKNAKTNRLATLHRIFLSEEGDKAPVPDAKRIMTAIGQLVGASIQLYPAQPGKPLGLCEGIETAIAVRAGTSMPVWPCVTAVLLEQVVLPDYIKHVVIWQDLDRSCRGEQASQALVTRLEAAGVSVEVCVPPMELVEGLKSIDWLDIWNLEGAEGFPEKWRVNSQLN